MSYLHSAHFSLQQANEMLETIRLMIDEVVELKQMLDAKGYDIYNHRYFGGSGPNGMGSFPAELEKLVEIVKIISARGVIIKGIDNGTIDFPHIRKNDEEVYLCWRRGEEEIMFWHPLGEGFKSRKNISDL